MIKILQISNGLGLGGTERGIEAICRLMTYGVFEHHVIGLLEGGERADAIARYAELTLAGGDVAKVREVIQRNRIDVVIIHRAGASDLRWTQVLRGCSEAGAKAIFEFNIFGLIDAGPEDALIDAHLHISKTSYLNAMRAAARSGYTRGDRHRVIHIPVDVSGFGASRLTDEARQAARAELGLKSADFALLRTGRPDVRKWGDLLLYVVPEVVQRIPAARFVFQSAPTSRADFMRRQWYANSVRVLPSTSDDQSLARVYSAADVYVHSSRRGESLGVSLIEAFAMGLPVVVNSTPWRDNAQIEVVDHMKNGIVANTVSAMADAIQYLFENPALRAVMGRNGQEKAMRCYDAQSVCASLAALIVETLRGKGAVAGLSNSQWGPIAPTMAELQSFCATEYAARCAQSWNDEAPRIPGTIAQRVGWFVRDAAEVLAARVGAGNHL